MSTNNKKSIFKKILDKGIDKLSRLERKYVQGIDYESDPAFQKEREKLDKEEFDKLFNFKGGQVMKQAGGKMLKGKQKNIDVAAPFGKITGADFKKLGDGDKVVSKMYGGTVMKKMYGGKMMKLAGGGMMPQVRRKKGKKIK